MEHLRISRTRFANVIGFAEFLLLSFSLLLCVTFIISSLTGILCHDVPRQRAFYVACSDVRMKAHPAVLLFVKYSALRILSSRDFNLVLIQFPKNG